MNCIISILHQVARSCTKELSNLGRNIAPCSCCQSWKYVCPPLASRPQVAESKHAHGEFFPNPRGFGTLSMMGVWLRPPAPWDPSVPYRCDVLCVLRETLNAAEREQSLMYLRDIFEILLNQPDIILYLPCIGWFGTANRHVRFCSKSQGKL